MGKSLASIDLKSVPRLMRRACTQAPTAASALRYIVPLSIFIAFIELLNRTGIGKPASDFIVIAVMLTCAWFSGMGPALLITPVLFLLSRLHREGPERWEMLGAEEFGSLTVIAIVCVSVALAGQYRRRIRAISAQNASQLEDQARALSLASILFRDVTGRITQWNEGSERLFGWKSDEAIGRLVHELLQSQFSQALEEIQQELTRTGQYHGEVVHRHKDGSELHVATHWILYRDKDGTAVGVAEIHNDVTALRRAEAAVREADRRKDEFLAVLAHELRNPLAPIRTGLELMRTVTDDPKMIEETRAVMERQMKQLVTLVDDLLDISRISRGKLELRKKLVPLCEVVQAALEATMPAIQASGHVLTVTLPEAPVYLDADPNRLAQVLSNLLDNSAKYTPAGGQIRLTAQCSQGELAVTIDDTGIGIPPDMQERIFEMFTRTDLTGIDQPGLGIGLALVRSIVEMHGGRIAARSEGPGRGSQFSIFLPIAASVPQPATEAPPAPSQYSEMLSTSKRVLIVDDNQAAATLLGMLVKNTGNEVRLAHDGEEAIAVARDFHPEIVLMDLGMPKLDGYDACRYIRQQPWGKEMLLVALTGWGQEGHRQRTRESGFDHHLVKPADPAELQRIFASAQSLRNESAAPVSDEV